MIVSSFKNRNTIAESNRSLYFLQTSPIFVQSLRDKFALIKKIVSLKLFMQACQPKGWRYFYVK